MTGIERDEEALDEAVKAAEFHDSRRTRGGSEFTGRLWDAITVIREHPDAGAVIDPPVRHFPLAVYPYDPIYVPEPEAILIGPSRATSASQATGAVVCSAAEALP